MQLHHQSSAASSLPDPTLGTQFFVEPVETRYGAQRKQVSITQPIPWPGKLAAKERSLRSKAKSVRFRRQDFKLELVFKVKSLLHRGILVRQNLAKMQEQIAYIDDLAKIAASKVKYGFAGQRDVAMAGVEKAHVEEQVKKLRVELESVVRKINVLRDRPVDTLVDFPDSIPFHRKPIEQQEDVSIATHPKLASIESQIVSQKELRKLADLAPIPDIKASLSWFDIDESTSPQKTTSDKDAWAIGASITIPIWSGKYHSQSASANAAVAELQELLSEEKQSLEAEILDVRNDAKRSLEVIELYEQSILPLADQVLRSNQKLYQQDRASFQNVIADFRKLLVYQININEEKERFATLVAKLESLRGAPLEEMN